MQTFPWLKKWLKSLYKISQRSTVNCTKYQVLSTKYGF
jgi:hypothetical protein